MSAASGAGLTLSPAASTKNESVIGYRPELDAVRFLAFLLVFFHHLILHSPNLIQRPLLTFSRAGGLIIEALDGGRLGLCLFFTLSAYLITSLLLAERDQRGHLSVRRFYIRRVLRIWPLYFFGIAIGLVIALALQQRNDVVGLFWFLFLAGNIYSGILGFLHNPMSPLWSISVEEQFYLIWPWAVKRFSRKGLLLCAIAFIAGANITLFILARMPIKAHLSMMAWTATPVQFEMFAVGILLALLGKRTRSWHAGFGLAQIGLGMILWFIAYVEFLNPASLTSGEMTTTLSLIFGYGLSAVGCGAVLHGFCAIQPSRIPGFVASLGKISYGLYVYHLLAIEFSTAVFRSSHGLLPALAMVLLALLLTIAAAIISYEYLETPFLRLKRKFEFLHSRPI